MIGGFGVGEEQMTGGLGQIGEIGTFRELPPGAKRLSGSFSSSATSLRSLGRSRGMGEGRNKLSVVSCQLSVTDKEQAFTDN